MLNTVITLYVKNYTTSFIDNSSNLSNMVYLLV